MIRPFFHRYVVAKFGADSSGITTMNNALDFAFSWEVGGKNIRPLQVRGEIEHLLVKLKGRGPRAMLEIGTYNGGTLFLFSRVLSPDAVMLSLDLPGGDFGGGSPEWWESVMRKFTHHKQEIRFIRADSHSPATLKKLSEMLNGRLLDFLFIDGDHSYEGVKRDFGAYSPLVTDGGLIAHHDVNEHLEYGVRKFWDEVKTRYDYEEIINDHSVQGYGIGILYI